MLPEVGGLGHFPNENSPNVEDLEPVLSVGSILHYFKVSHVDQPWCIWIPFYIHIVGTGRIFLPAADWLSHSIIWHFQLCMHMRKVWVCLVVDQSQYRWNGTETPERASSIFSGQINPTWVPASVTLFSHFPPITRMSYCCSYPQLISPWVLGSPVLCLSEGFCSWCWPLALLNHPFLYQLDHTVSHRTFWSFSNPGTVR